MKARENVEFMAEFTNAPSKGVLQVNSVAA